MSCGVDFIKLEFAYLFCFSGLIPGHFFVLFSSFSRTIQILIEKRNSTKFDYRSVGVKNIKRNAWIGQLLKTAEFYLRNGRQNKDSHSRAKAGE